jgi:ABC-type multidrug transport system ATPase subunit/ABC-type multidrug transport system permease subunit
LLDLLAARKLVGTWSGEVYLDDIPRSKYFARDSAYVLQDDVHISTLTVEETIRYAARTKLPEGTTKREIEKRVDLLLQMMSLSHVKDSRVGDPMTKGISGGQLKRLSIAVEIVALPRVIFLDEPTSGLDSAIAFEVMSTVRNIIDAQHTCVCTIHQPSRDIFALFNKLVLVSGGRLIYFGTVDDAVTYFSQQELGYRFEGGYRNPAEFVIEISCGQLLPDGFKVPRQPEELEVLYKSSRFYRPSALAARTQVNAVEEEDDPWGLYDSRRYMTSPLTQLSMLMERTWIAKIRDVPDMKAQALKNFSIALFFGIVFYNAGDISGPFYEDGKLTSEASSVNSFLFFFTIICMVANVQNIPYMCSRTRLYKRELASNSYSPLPYWLASLLITAPILFVFHFLAASIAYGMAGFNSNGSVYIYFVFTSFAGSMIAATTGMSLAANAPDEAAALAIFPLQFLIFTTFSGYTVRVDDLPIYWKWASYISYPKWIFEGLMVNEWQQFDTDDESGPENGNGDVLADYSFDSFALGDAIWIALLFALIFAATMYYGLLPPVNRLIKVGNASDVVTVLSKNGSVASSISSASSRGRKAVRGMRKGKQGGNDLKANLMESGGNLEESLVVEDPLLEHEPKHTVDSYRISSGVVDRAHGCRLVFRDVHYSVTSKADGVTEAVLLKGVTGRAMPGEMVALMGASGAGKSTLLDVLAQRKNTGKIGGSITYNGSSEMTSFAYVMQDNVHMGILTVRESIHYAAELRLHQMMSAEAKAKRVEKIIDMLGLQKVADTILGTENVRGISGGQLKRVSIGVEIINLPNLMFLDEPTTGLDSSISLEVMSAVRNLANQNRTVICTIHQPSEDTFALFDTLLLLAEGRVIYFGPAATTTEYFTLSPYKFVCKTGANPADFVVAVAGSFVPAGDGRMVPGGELAAYYATTEQARLAEEVFGAEVAAAVPKLPENPLLRTTPHEESNEGDAGPHRTDLWHQLKVLLHRRVTVIKKDPMPTIGPVLRYVAPQSVSRVTLHSQCFIV